MCGNSLAGKRPQARFCSINCSTNFRNAQVQEALRVNRKPCVNCGDEIPLYRRRFCSDDCKRAARRPETYGLKNSELQALLGQHEVCAICATDKWGRKGPQVDHNHANGKVRGILCVNCNTLLGHVNDDPTRLRAAIAYLEG